MPPADKNEVHRLISSRYSNPAGKAALDGLPLTIHGYIRDRYTNFRSLDIHETQDSKALDEAHQRVDKILASWRGEGKRLLIARGLQR